MIEFEREMEALLGRMRAAREADPLAYPATDTDRLAQAHARIEALVRERDALIRQREAGLAWFWEIVDRGGFDPVPSDEADALARIMRQREAGREVVEVMLNGLICTRPGPGCDDAMHRREAMDAGAHYLGRKMPGEDATPAQADPLARPKPPALDDLRVKRLTAAVDYCRPRLRKDSHKAALDRVLAGAYVPKAGG